MISAFRLSLLLAATALASPAFAQDDMPPDRDDVPLPRAEPTRDDLHDPIVVTAAGLGRLDVLAGTSVIAGAELQRNLDGQVGEVLAKVAGVSATGFAPGASRPVLRGFGGERVRVLTDGIGSLDASGASADHAVAVDPLIADRVEVLRGPAVLLYGNQAIGGAVNVITRRIPPRLPDEPLHIDVLLAADTAYDLREGGLSLDAPLGGGFAAHIDGSWRETDDVEIPAYAASPRLRAQLLAAEVEEREEGHGDEADELAEAAAIRDVLPNSFTRARSIGAGLAWFSGESNIGLSVDYYDTDYGIPGLPGIGHVHGEEAHDDGHEDDDHDDADHGDHGGEEHGEESVSIGLKRYRADLRGVFDTGGGFLDEIRTRWGWSTYTHTEFEGDEVGTVFDVDGLEGRLEFVQSRRGAWQGSFGGQYSHVDFDALGDEAFVPPSVTENFAVFALQEFDLEAVELELGGRYEHTGVSIDTLGRDRNFGTLSGALGASAPVAGNVRAGINFSRAERAPSAQELFANGPHVATQQFEIGNPALGIEGSWGIEGYLRGTLGAARMSAAIYRNWFDNFIFLSANGNVEDGLPVFNFLQKDADQFGVEAELTLPVYKTDGFTLLTDLRGDYVRATLADGTHVPRIPPLSLLGALEAQWDHFDARAEVEYFAAQNRIAPEETPTDSFAHVNLSLAWHPIEGDDNFTLTLQANNLLDAEGRRHASFTKDFVPLPGRNIRVRARASF